MIDTVPLFQLSSPPALNTDHDPPSESQETPLPILPGNLPVPTIRDTNDDALSLLSEHGDSAPSLRGLDDRNQLNRGKSDGYSVFLTTQDSLGLFSYTSDLLPSPSKIRDPSSSIWSRLCKYAQVERRIFVPAVVVT